MKIFLSIKFFIIFIFLLGYCSLVKSASFAQPSIHFYEIYYDFGEIKKDDFLTHIFEFENTGSDILTIEKIRSDCGCISTNLMGKDTEYGEKGQIKVSFRPQYMEGIQEKNVFVHSNDPDFSILKLSVLAKVNVAAILKPSILYLSDLSGQNSKKVNFKNKLERNLAVISIELEKDLVDYKILNAEQTVPTTIKPNQNLDIMVTLKIKGCREPFHTELIIHTDYSDYSDFKVSINCIPDL